MKRLQLALTFALMVMLNAASASSDDSTISSIIDDSFSEGAYTRFRITMIDGELFFKVKPKEISPGTHQIDILICTGAGGNCVKQRANCTTESGMVYRVNEKGCYQYQRRTDFDGAKEYWDKHDAALKEKREAELLAARKVAEEIEAAQYLADKAALADAKTTSDVDKVIKSVEWRLKLGIHNDPDKVLNQASQKRAIFEKKEAAENARLEAQRMKDEARLAKEDSSRKMAEKKRLADFRKRLAEGSETNCGPIIEVKGQLVKVAHPVANYGNEHWIRKIEIFPNEYSCSFYNGQYQPPL